MAESGSPLGERMKSKLRVLLVDDHPLVRRGAAEMINEQPDMEVCGETGAAGEALTLVKQTNPHLVLVDLSLSSGHGIELIEQIRAYNSEIKMIVASVHDEELYAERSLRAGAVGYINKQEASDKLVEAIRHVLGGDVYLSGNMANHMLRSMVNGEQPEGDPVRTLSNRELEVFELIGEGKTTKQVAAQLHLSPKTIETHREKIKMKLNLGSSTELTRRAVQWVLESR